MTEPQRRVIIRWTNTAKEGLTRLPREIRRGILGKVDGMYDCTDIKALYKPLLGPLLGFYSLRFSRYRAVFCVEEDKIANGDVIVTIKITFVIAGKREARSRDDVYEIARKLLEHGVIGSDEVEDEGEAPD